MNRLKEWKHLLIPDAIQSVYVLLPAGCLDGSGNMVRSWPTNQSPGRDIEKDRDFGICNLGLVCYIKNNILVVVFWFSYLQ